MHNNSLLRSFAHAVAGVIHVLRTERNFKIEALALVINLFLIVYLKVSALEATVLLFICFSVLSLEMVNTCIEKTCDLVEPRFDARIKIIKDMAAGAVLLMALASVAAALFIYLPYLV